uniref:Amine oxidase domain-containing protein n=1 Tax=Rhodosorus marinus TaxID=101924 RepID=A0A7S0BT17_9RHOD|mmetsp:Transcript_7717/g.11446  ORF Transcript_7717/g.11446 Transcript_7717/m.11446 type:complete len:301 (+) Transcript_7717:658-1560(+)
MDKARVALLRTKIASLPLDSILQRDECTTAEYLRREGFTSSMIDRFFTPFYEGIGAVTQHVAAPLRDKIQLNTGVKSISMNENGGGTVDTEDGQKIEAKVIIVAADPLAASALFGDRIEPSKPRGCANLYFASDQAPPIAKPILFLNGEGRSAGVVGNTCFPSSFSETYAPEGKTLVSTTVIGDDVHRSDAELERLVKSHMSEWWGSNYVNQWTHLKTYKIPFSQPAQNVPFSASKGVEVGRGVFVCGDHRSAPHSQRCYLVRNPGGEGHTQILNRLVRASEELIHENFGDLEQNFLKNY